MRNYDPYISYKKGIKKDISGFATNLAGALGFFFLLWFLAMMFWAVASPISPASPVTKIICLILLVIIIPCLFFRRTANFILSLWGILMIILGYLIILVPAGYFIYVMFGVAFGYL